MGFYVFAKRRVSSPRGIARYVARYVRYPAIAESRISEFNQLLNSVTFWYNDSDGGGGDVLRLGLWSLLVGWCVWFLIGI
jgi:hypothetical protein